MVLLYLDVEVHDDQQVIQMPEISILFLQGDNTNIAGLLLVNSFISISINKSERVKSQNMTLTRFLYMNTYIFV